MGYMGNGMGGNNYFPVNEYGYNAAQDRLNMMEQQRGYGMQNQGMQSGGQMQMFKGRPVSNFYEANASLIDLDGSLHIFPDLANNRIYTKKVTLDGTADLKTYVLTDNPVDELNPNKGQNSAHMGHSGNADIGYVGRAEFENCMKALEDRLNYFMGRVEGMIGGMMDGRQQQYAGECYATVPTNEPDVQIVQERRPDGPADVREQSPVRPGTADGKRKNRG